MNVRELSNSLALSRAVLQMHGVDLQLVNPPEEPDTTVAYLIFNRAALERTSNPESSNIRELLVPFQELETMVRSNYLKGFAIVPAPEIFSEVWAQRATEHVGQTLQALSTGQLSV